MFECNEKFCQAPLNSLQISEKYKYKQANNNKTKTICKLPKSRHGRILATFLAPPTM